LNSLVCHQVDLLSISLHVISAKSNITFLSHKLPPGSLYKCQILWYKKEKKEKNLGCFIKYLSTELDWMILYSSFFLLPLAMEMDVMFFFGVGLTMSR
jgi:hypothetical protein